MDWTRRARTYDNLDWPSSQQYLAAMVGACGPAKRALDVGCGTGKVARAVAQRALEVVGIDTSAAMLARAQVPDNVQLVQADVRNLQHWPDGDFDCITARMVFHHVLTGLPAAIRECWRVLRPGGRLVVAEGVPPHPAMRDWFAAMMAHKERRHTFLEGDLAQMLLARFDQVHLLRLVLPDMSLRNWLENGGVPAGKRRAIWEAHAGLDAAGRRYYNLREVEGDMLMDWAVCIAVGVK